MKHKNQVEQPALPQQLQPDYDESAQAVFAEWQAKPFDAVINDFAPAITFENGDKSMRYTTIGPKSGEADPESTVFIALPAGKTLTPETFITMSVVHELVNPSGTLIVAPNNNKGDISYTVSKEERERIKRGDFSPLSERHTRLLEGLGIDSLALVMGHSLGATLAASLGDFASPYMQMRANLLDEAPNTFADGRTAAELRKSVMRENKELMPAYRSIGLPALNEAIHLDHLARFKYELLRWAIGGNIQQPNPAINSGFKIGGFYDDVASMLAQNEAATVLLTNALSSTVGAPDEIAAFADVINNELVGNEVARQDTYDGYHVTAGNPFVLGLLGRRALKQQDQVGIYGQDFTSVNDLKDESLISPPTDQQ